MERVLTWPAERWAAVVRAARDTFLRVPERFHRTPPDAAVKPRLNARVSSDSPDAVGRFLAAKFGANSITREGGDWIVHVEIKGASARDANRELLSELRRVERKTRLRAEWTSGGLVERFFDYVSKGTRPIGR